MKLTVFFILVFIKTGSIFGAETKTTNYICTAEGIGDGVGGFGIHQISESGTTMWDAHLNSLRSCEEFGLRDCENFSCNSISIPLI